MSTNRRSTALLLATAISLASARAAEADVTIQERVAVEGSGIMSVAGMSGTSTTAISGKRARMESDMRMHSGFIRFLARGAGQTTEIVRLDDDTIYVLDPKKKRYRETTVAARRAELAKAMEQTSQAQQASPMAFDDSQCDWSPPKLTVGKTGAKATFAGLSAEPVSILVKQSCKDRQTGAVCDIALLFESWVAQSSGAAQEALQYRAAFAQQMGFPNAERDVTERAQALFGRYKEAWSAVAAEIHKVHGFPVKTQFALGLGGDRCNGPAGADAGASGAPSPKAIASEIAGLFGKKKAPPDDSSAATSAPASGALSGMVVPLRVTSELSSIVSEPLSPSTFEVPEGFRKSAP